MSIPTLAPIPDLTTPLLHRRLFDGPNAAPRDFYVYGGRIGLIITGPTADDVAVYDFWHPAVGYNWFNDMTGAYREYRYVIVDPTTGDYWNNADGWGDETTATRFSAQERTRLRLPLSGQWQALSSEEK
jgi:hypothetical protein